MAEKSRRITSINFWTTVKIQFCSIVIQSGSFKRLVWKYFPSDMDWEWQVWTNITTILQSHSNCGLWLKEEFVWYLTRNPLSQTSNPQTGSKINQELTTDRHDYHETQLCLYQSFLGEFEGWCPWPSCWLRRMCSPCVLAPAANSQGGQQAHCLQIETQ